MSKILIIEDDKNTRDIYSLVLKEAGFVVEEATDGEMGLFKATEGGYNLILLDVMLPRRDGISILTELKAKPPKVPNGKIILLSNLSHEQIVNQAIGLGATRAITKSAINPGQLVEEVKKELNTPAPTVPPTPNQPPQPKS